MKKMNSRGFSMLELLASIVLLGIMMGVALPAVMGILRNTKMNTYVGDSLRFISTVDNTIRKDNKMEYPAVDECLFISLEYVNNNTFEEAPNGGTYDKKRSFVLAKRIPRSSSGQNFTYYVRLVERTQADSFMGVDLVEKEKLVKENASKKYITTIGSEDAWNLSQFNDRKAELRVKVQNSPYLITCTNVFIYAPQAAW